MLRGRYHLWMDAIVAAELIAGCRSRTERRIVDGLTAPFARAERVRTATAAELDAAGRALSKLRERAVSLKNPAGALLDATIAVNASRAGALLVSENVRDFEKLATVVPLRFEPIASFAERLATPSSWNR